MIDEDRVAKAVERIATTLEEGRAFYAKLCSREGMSQLSSVAFEAMESAQREAAKRRSKACPDNTCPECGGYVAGGELA